MLFSFPVTDVDFTWVQCSARHDKVGNICMTLRIFCVALLDCF